jgi:CO/xanthine dehydrogenase FAD-binding subunit
MKPPPFKYVSAGSLEQALAVKAEHGDEARFLAGGQSLVPTLNFRLAQPAVLIDINSLNELSGVRRENGHALRIGALTRYHMLERDPLVREWLPLVIEALPHIAHPQIRNRGTLGGNLAHADPASELPAIVVALQARLHVQSATGERCIAARDFFRSALTTALKPDEMLTEIELPSLPARTGCCFMEVARRRGDFALMGVALALTLDEQGRGANVRMALCGAADTPLDVSAAAAGTNGETIDQQSITAIASRVQQMIDPPGSIHASKEFQRHLAGVLVDRALPIALERARHG